MKYTVITSIYIYYIYIYTVIILSLCTNHIPPGAAERVVYRDA